MSDPMMKFGVIGSIVVLALSIPSCVCLHAINQKESGVVVEKYTKRTSGEHGGDEFRLVVDTPNGREVFRNVDSLVNWKWNSADIQAGLDVGAGYKLVVTGIRVPFLSMFRNVIAVEATND